VNSDIKQVVKDKYGDAARKVIASKPESTCCGQAASSCCDPITSNLYDTAQTKDLPEAAVLASLGCGNPTALANRRGGAGPRLGWWHRRFALGQTSRANRQSVRPRHD